MMTAALAFTLLLANPAPQKTTLPAQIKTYDGKTITLTGHKATVLIFLLTTCPIARAQQPTITKLHDDFAPKGVQFVGIQVDPDLDKDDLAQYVKDYKTPLPQVLDSDHKLVKALHAKVTPESFVIDSNGKIVYHGRVDNSYPALGVRKEPTAHELRDALTAVLDGKSPKVASTPLVGCFIPD